jgi:hypothetical protein
MPWEEIMTLIAHVCWKAKIGWFRKVREKKQNVVLFRPISVDDDRVATFIGFALSEARGNEGWGVKVALYQDVNGTRRYDSKVVLKVSLEDIVSIQVDVESK